MDMEGSKYGKIMEKKVCHVWVVKKLSSVLNLDVGESVQSDPFMVGGNLFRVHLYPWGKNQNMHIRYSMCICLENLSAEGLELVQGFEILTWMPFPKRHLRKSSFDDRLVYREVTSVAPGAQTRPITFHESCIDRTLLDGYTVGDMIKIRTSVGLLVDAFVPPLDPLIFFDIHRQRFYAEESVLKERCPALLPNQVSNSTSQSTNVDVNVNVNVNVVELSDIVDSIVFGGILWHIYHKPQVHRSDQELMSESINPRDPKSYCSRMRAAAHRFNLTHLTTMCDGFVYYGSLDLYGTCYPIERAFKKLWSILRNLWSWIHQIQEAN